MTADAFATEPGADPAGWRDVSMVRRRGLRGWLRRHPWWTNTFIVLIYLLVSAGVFPAAIVDIGAPAWWLVPGHLVIGGLLFLRHTRPLSVLIAVTLAETAMLAHYPWHGAQMVGLWFAAYCVGLHRGLVVALLTAVPASLLGYASYLRIEAWTAEYGESIWITDFYQIPVEDLHLPGLAAVLVVAMVFTTGIVAAIGAAVRSSRNHEAEILEWARQGRELAQVGERNRIAREMHDVVAHSLSVMISLADGARVVGRKDPERAAEVLEELSSTGRSALADMRRVIGVLKKGEELGEARRPIRESLDELYDGFRQAGLPLRVSTEGPPLPEDAAFGLTVHRILQEALTNVLRYGRQVAEVRVTTEHVPATGEQERAQLKEQGFSDRDQLALGLAGAAQVIITVSDDGVHTGPRESVGSGLGIRGMQERAGFYNGSVYAGPGKHRGWTVRAVLEPPLRETAQRGTE